jgi:hypothetical protein
MIMADVLKFRHKLLYDPAQIEDLEDIKARDDRSAFEREIEEELNDRVPDWDIPSPEVRAMVDDPNVDDPIVKYLTLYPVFNDGLPLPRDLIWLIREGLADGSVTKIEPGIYRSKSGVLIHDQWMELERR